MAAKRERVIVVNKVENILRSQFLAASKAQCRIYYVLLFSVDYLTLPDWLRFFFILSKVSAIEKPAGTFQR